MSKEHDSLNFIVFIMVAGISIASFFIGRTYPLRITRVAEYAQGFVDGVKGARAFDSGEVSSVQEALKLYYKYYPLTGASVYDLRTVEEANQ